MNATGRIWGECQIDKHFDRDRAIEVVSVPLMVAHAVDLVLLRKRLS